MTEKNQIGNKRKRYSFIQWKGFNLSFQLKRFRKVLVAWFSFPMLTVLAFQVLLQIHYICSKILLKYPFIDESFHKVRPLAGPIN